MYKVDLKHIDELYASVCAAKKLSSSVKGFRDYKNALTSIYHAVCLDIDDTLTYANTFEKKGVVETLAYLTKCNVILCFITGRGKKSAFEFLQDLKNAITLFDANIRENQFRRWYCITNNGYMLFSYDFLNGKGFLEQSVCLVDPKIRNKYMELKSTLQSEAATLLSKRLDIPEYEIIRDSNASIGENSLRFPFKSEYDSAIDDTIILDLRKIVKEHTEFRFGVNRGVYHKNNKTVIEISMTTKGEAIDKFEKHLGIPKNKMVRIGDQGDYSGNDFEMLDSSCGFSVGKFSVKEGVCWPVSCYVQIDTEIVTGVEGTVALLNALTIFPTICLEKPDENIYLPRLAMSESRNISANRDTYDYYHNLLRYAFKSTDKRITSVWDYIDERTGGFYIHDSEYELLKASSPNHILFRIYDSHQPSRTSKQPRLKFAVKTDSGLLLRGPLNYYYGLSFRQGKRSEIKSSFARCFSQNRIHFFKTCIYNLKQCRHIDVKDSIVRRTLLGIMDSVRDYLLVLLNIRLQERVTSKDVLYFFMPKERELFELYGLAKENLIYMYNCLFDNIEANFVDRFLTFMTEKIMPVAQIADTYFYNLELHHFDFKRGCRVWREIDSFYENLIAVDTSINKMLYECNLEKKELLLYGIRYGSLELPIIAAMLLEVKYKYFNIKYCVGALCLKSNYSKNHEEMLSSKRTLNSTNRRRVCSEEYFHILMDDNLVTGRTLQIAVNMLINHRIYPDRVIVVRYPAINRIRHMLLPNHGAPDPDLFWEYIYGLTSPTPYSRLNHPFSYKKKPDDKYLDELGEFNKVRKFVLDILFKNGLYTPEGEVAQRGETR